MEKVNCIAALLVVNIRDLVFVASSALYLEGISSHLASRFAWTLAGLLCPCQISCCLNNFTI